jgi:hypothetical protein
MIFKGNEIGEFENVLAHNPDGTTKRSVQKYVEKYLRMNEDFVE